MLSSTCGINHPMRGFLETREIVRRMLGKRVEGHAVTVRHIADLIDISEQAVRSHVKALGRVHAKTNGGRVRSGKVRS